MCNIVQEKLSSINIGHLTSAQKTKEQIARLSGISLLREYTEPDHCNLASEEKIMHSPCRKSCPPLEANLKAMNSSCQGLATKPDDYSEVAVNGTPENIQKAFDCSQYSRIEFADD